MDKITKDLDEINLKNVHSHSKKIINVEEILGISEALELIKTKREPFILKNYNLGPCMQKWTVDYLKSVVKDKQVKIHVSSVSNMDFLKKNFLYRLDKPFFECKSSFYNILMKYNL